MRLSERTAHLLDASVTRFTYPRDAMAVGIVHIGVGAFHRAHQAWYTDRAMEGGDRDWAIAGVSLRSSTAADQLNAQDGLYTLTERAADNDDTRLIGSIREVLVGPKERAIVVERLSAQQTRVVTFTITEKGYCRAADGTLDLQLADNDSVYSYLAASLARRKAAGLPGLTMVSCDNLAHNGRQLGGLMRQYLDAFAPDLLAWFDAECRCPSTMVDRIVPASTTVDKEALSRRIDLADEGAVFTEPFSQWVIEDDFVAGRPMWEAAGAQLVSDVAPYETAKLRMLNGAHSALAYLGLERRHRFVHQALADPAIAPIIERLLKIEAAPTIAADACLDLDVYACSLLERFANPSLEHRLEQIAMDGSQKIPQRWLETLAARGMAGADCPAVVAGIAAWLRHVRGDNGKVDDPRAVALADAWQRYGSDGIADAIFGDGGVLGRTWRLGDRQRQQIQRALTTRIGA